MIDMAKAAAVPATPGPPVVVGTCDTCGGDITKQFVKHETVPTVPPRMVDVFNITCARGGDEHVVQNYPLTLIDSLQKRSRRAAKLEKMDGRKHCIWCGKAHDAPGVFCFECY